MAFLAVVLVLAAACLVASLPIGGWPAIDFRGTKHTQPVPRRRHTEQRTSK